MRPTISSVEFRRTYTKLAEATVVTVNGHSIGLWEPAIGYGDRDIAVVKGRGGGADTVLDTRKAQQAERDRILRAMNKG